MGTNRAMFDLGWKGWAAELADLGLAALWWVGACAVLGGLLLGGAEKSMNGHVSGLSRLCTWSGVALLVAAALITWLPKDAL